MKACSYDDDKSCGRQPKISKGSAVRFLSIAIFTVLMIWTWNVIHRDSTINFETHAGIQNKMIELIEATVLEKKPQARSLSLDHLWTEAVSDNQVKVFFSYRFQEPASEGSLTATTSIDGHAILQKQANEDRWVIQSVQTQKGLEFSEGTVISPGSSNEDSDSNEDEVGVSSEDGENTAQSSPAKAGPAPAAATVKTEKKQTPAPSSPEKSTHE